jgi:predicted ATP-grasp superfamily ATP-dependent carboligase
MAILPEPIGYIGVDMVLGEDALGAGDAVIEINPRLTTSFVGLRAIARTNLAQAMLAVAEGAALSPKFTDGGVAFTADGSLVRHAGSDHLP